MHDCIEILRYVMLTLLSSADMIGTFKFGAIVTN